MNRIFSRVAAMPLSLVLGTVAGASEPALLSLPGEQKGDAWGVAVADAGDMDKDGVTDFLIGASGAQRARLVSGRDGRTIHEWFGSLGFGRAVAGAGDVNKDGFSDLMVAAEDEVSVYSGKNAALLYFYHYDDKDFGHSIAGVADVNADGFADFAVGAPLADDNGFNRGMVLVYSGKTGLPLYQFDGPSEQDHAGWSVCGAGDLNKDGYADVLVASPRYDPFGVMIGIVHARSGKDGKVLGSVTGPSNDCWFGFSLAAGGDLDLDGFPDFLVGAPKDGPNVGHPGSVTAVSGKDFSKLHVWKASLANGEFGYAVDFTGDHDADGIEDIVIGAPSHVGSGGTGYHGVVRVYSGASADVLKTHHGSWFATEAFGAALVGFDDVNGDGIGDVLAADPKYHALDVDQGAAWLLSGKDYFAFAQVYGSGWPGTQGVPDLTTSAQPVLCRTIDLALENSLGANTSGALLIGSSSAQIQTKMGGTVLVAPPWTIVTLVIPAQGLSVPVDVFCDTTLAGVNVYLQGIMWDSGASQGVAFSPGLRLQLGG